MTAFPLKCDPLTAISPLDGRYADKLAELSPFVSEFGLIRFRVKVEIAWLQALCAQKDIPEARRLTEEEIEALDNLADNFAPADALRVKEIEREINHDVKAVEYFIKERLDKTTMSPLREFVHFACTSEDISNLAHALMIRSALDLLIGIHSEFTAALLELAEKHKSVPMLSHTHGQNASPTTVGKEIAVFIRRINSQARGLKNIRLRGKMNGAVGNYNAHIAAYPNVNWPAMSRHVVEDKLGLDLNPLTTQIEPHDYIAEVFDTLARMNTILLDFDRDMWSYISMGYFVQRPVAGEVGSSTMPHKVNPIDFENSEGNLGIANALLEHMARKLPISRMQRDLSDSTVLRNIGSAFGYTMLGWMSARKGLSKIKISPLKLERDLNNSWEVMAEAIQTIMRKAGLPDPYERLKEMTRGRVISAEIISDFVASLDVDEADKRRLLAMSPSSYLGLAVKLAESARDDEKDGD